MSRRHSRRAQPFRRWCVAVCFLLGCGDSPADVEPEPEPTLPREALALGAEVSGQVSEGVWDTVFYRVPAGVTAALHIESSPVGLHVAMQDTVAKLWLGTHFSTDDTPSAVRLVAPGVDERILLLAITDNRQDESSGPMTYRASLFRIETLPEGEQATLSWASPVSSELEAPADVDVYRLAAAAGDRFVVFLRTLAPVWLSADVLAPGDTVPVSTSNFLGIDSRASGRPLPGVTATGQGMYEVRVRHSHAWSADLTAPYRLEVLKLPPPDAVPTSLQPNTEVEFVLTPYGDEDAYIVRGAQGDVFRLFARADTAGRLAVHLSNEPHNIMELEWDAAFGEYITPPFTVTGDSASIRVFRQSDERLDELPYTLRLWQADPAPETIASVLPDHGRLTGEAIDTLGDVDEFIMTLAQASTVTTIADPSVPGIAVSYFTPQGEFIDIGPGDIAMDHQTSMGLGPGEHRLRLTGNQGFTGSYGLRVFVTSHLPEDVPMEIRPGDTVVETANQLRDTDQFELIIDRERVFITLQGLGKPGGEPISVMILREPPWAISSPAAADTPSIGLRADFPGAGAYPLVVHSRRIGPAWQDTGSYRLSVVAADTAVESGVSVLAPGDTITSTLDNVGDVDRFTVVAIPGVHVRIEMEHVGGPYRQVLLWEDDTQTWLRGAQGTFDTVATLSDVLIPPSGRVTVDVIAACHTWQPQCIPPPNTYELRVLQQ